MPPSRRRVHRTFIFNSSRRPGVVPRWIAEICLGTDAAFVGWPLLPPAHVPYLTVCVPCTKLPIRCSALHTTTHEQIRVLPLTIELDSLESDRAGLNVRLHALC
jgi:hypothetical protein